MEGFDLCGLCSPVDTHKPSGAGLSNVISKPQQHREVAAQHSQGLTRSSSRESLEEKDQPRRTSLLKREESFATKAVKPEQCTAAAARMARKKCSQFTCVSWPAWAREVAYKSCPIACFQNVRDQASSAKMLKTADAQIKEVRTRTVRVRAIRWTALSKYLRARNCFLCFPTMPHVISRQRLSSSDQREWPMLGMTGRPWRPSKARKTNLSRSSKSISKRRRTLT